MARLKDATFEAASLTGTSGFNSVSATSPTLDSGSVVKGTYSARCNWTGSTNVNGVISGLSATEVFFSFYIRLGAQPAATCRVLSATNGTTQWSFRLTTGGVLQWYNGSTFVANVATLSTGTNYRVGIRFKCSTAAGNADGIAEVYVATGDAAFGSAAYSTSAYLMVTSNAAITSVTFGHNNGASATGDIYFDNIRVDDAAMPTDDVSGGSVALDAAGVGAASGSASLSVSGSSSVALSASGGGSATGSASLGVSGSGSVALTASGAAAAAAAATLGVSGTSPVNLSAGGTGAAVGTATLTALASAGFTAAGFAKAVATAELSTAGGSRAFTAAGIGKAVGSATLGILAVGGWHWTRMTRPLLDRYISTTIASTGGEGYLGYSADGITWKWYAGPLAADGRTLTEVASEAAAKAAPVALPTAGRWDIPIPIDARFVKLGHRTVGGVGLAYTLREFYPRRMVEADDIRAESIKAIHVAAGNITADHIAAAFTITGKRIQTAASGARVLLSGEAFGGFIGYGAADTYDPTLGTGTYQVRWNKADGKLYTGGGAFVFGSTGVNVFAEPNADIYNPNRAITWYEANGTTVVGKFYATYFTNTHKIRLEALENGTTVGGTVSIFGSGTTASNNADISVVGGRTGVNSSIGLSANVITAVATVGNVQVQLNGASTQTFAVVSGGLIVGSSAWYSTNSTAAAEGQIVTQGMIQSQNEIRAGTASYTAFTGSVQCNGWFRSYGSTGWHNQTYGGGWNMTGTTWIESYGGKAVLLETGTGTQLQLQASGSSGEAGNLRQIWQPGTLTTGTAASYSIVNYFNGTAMNWYSSLLAANVLTIDHRFISGTGNTGRVGIRKDAPGWALEVGFDSCAKPNGGSWTNSSSDARTKTIISDYKYGLAEVRRLHLVEYEYNGRGDTVAGLRGYGFIAQEAQAVIPEMVQTRMGKLDPQDEHETELLTLNNDPALLANIRAVQELAAMVDELRAEVARLKGKK